MYNFIILIIATFSGKQGIIDIQGNTVIPFEHEKIYRYREGRFVASKYIQSSEGEKLLYGAYDELGSTVIPFIFDELTAFWNSYSTGKLRGKAVIIDHYGNVLFESDYSLIEPFNDLGYARVTKGGKQGFIDKNFKEVIPPSYAWSNSYNRHGRWHIKWTSANREALIDTNQTIVFEAPDNHIIKIGGILNNYVISYDNNNHFQAGMFSINGQIILPHVYEDLSVNLRGLYHNNIPIENNPVYAFGRNKHLGYSELFKFSDDGSFQLQCSKPIIEYGNGIDCFVFGSEVNGINQLGLMNTTCEQLIEPKFQEIYYLLSENDTSFQTSLFRTLKDGKYGLIQGNGEELLQPNFPKFINLFNGLFNIDDQNRSLVFDKSGEIIFESDSIRIWFNIKGTNNYCAKSSEGKYGIYDLKQNTWAIEPKFDYLQFEDFISITRP